MSGLLGRLVFQLRKPIEFPTCSLAGIERGIIRVAGIHRCALGSELRVEGSKLGAARDPIGAHCD
ncbi:hypothetical protein MKK88_13370 [Methylobacterium sp. E-005]|uniref:hypothetical protein n=1 Tax=Methylobacterium sp. E-005 TaxID=2836549 RepID=UPI001FBB0BFD|nr:hypothetical protein [Methylobacterium sp. E-005]MCJ2086972.1 hypothetical protein [Methylobacterium sp. E-005]